MKIRRQVTPEERAEERLIAIEEQMKVEIPDFWRRCSDKEIANQMLNRYGIPVAKSQEILQQEGGLQDLIPLFAQAAQ